MKQWRTFTVVLITLMLLACSGERTDIDMPKAYKGVFDLKGWDFARHGTIKIDGEWAFFWNYLLPLTGNSDNQNLVSPQYIKVPGVWNRRQSEIQELPQHGFASYRLRVLLPESGKALALKIPHMSSAFRLFLDGEKIASNGIVGTGRDVSAPEFRPIIHDFTPQKSEIDLLVHISNYDYYKGGIWRSLQLGYEADIRAENLRKVAYQIFYFGSIFIIAIYNIGMFVFRRKETAPLYFGLFCFLVAIRIIVTDEIYIKYLFPDFPWQVLVRSQILTFYAAVPVFFLYLHSLYSNEFSSFLYRSILGFGLIFSAVVLFTTTSFSSRTLHIYQIFTVLSLIYIIYILIRAAIRNREGAILFIVGIVITSIAIVNDILFVNFIVNTGFFVQFGFFLFILIQVFLLISRSSNAYSRVESLGEQLTEYSSTLEQKVLQRTNELHLSLESVESSSKKILASIEYAKRIQDSLLPILSEVRRFLPHSFFLWRPRDIVGGDLYFAKTINGKHVVATIDCTGHGVPGAFMTMIAASGMGRIVVDDLCLDPAEILNRLNSIVKISLQQEKQFARSDDGLDASICVIDRHHETLTFAGARQPLVYIKNKQLHRIKGDRQSIGYKNSNLDFQFTNHEVELNSDICFYLYTDGITDQLGGEKQFSFGRNRLNELLLEIHDNPFDQQEKMITEAFKAYKGSNETQDDVTVVGFRVEL